MSKPDVTTTKLDDAARAGWLYYVAGNTQDEIAAKLGISRQSAQRMVSLAVSEGLVKVRLDHPIAHCLDLAEQLKQRFGLKMAEVVPTDPGSSSTTLGVADAAAAEMTRWLKSEAPIVLGIGTGRTLKAAIELLSPIECPQHKVVSLTGNISPDGSAAFYNVIFNIADKIKARSFPDAAAGHRLFAGGARAAAQPGDDPPGAGIVGAGECRLCRHRRPRGRRAAVHRWLHFARGTGRSAPCRGGLRNHRPCLRSQWRAHRGPDQ